MEELVNAAGALASSPVGSQVSRLRMAAGRRRASRRDGGAPLTLT
jgi:hypothetical protein